ncbi:MAG TPA: peptidoglycan bridge formation glycyltransferase FemA/FemB family protein [Candidatus Saccharimonadales bacterium]|nr:peptidoglycan bridge formation glycyltransferase FemA/FemB family protein [Candidatus Saccharimonadales bacterium]
MTPDDARWDKMQSELGASFLQSALWGGFQASIGHKPHYLSGPGWSCLLLERRAAVGSYLFAPYGPTINDVAALTSALTEIKSFSAAQNADWVRLEPVISSAAAECHRTLRQAGGLPAPRDVEPHLTRIVDLSRPAEDILASLSQTTRNLIRRNQREKTLVFKTSHDPADIPVFTKMLDTVASRKGVGFYPASYYLKQAQDLMPAGMMVLEMATLNGRPAGTAIIHDYHKTSTYTYAASDPKFRDKNVSALLLWQALINAKQRGSTAMDLYGIAPDDAPASHPWAGFSSFKKKFGGEVIEHAGTWDFPLTRRYRIYLSALKIKKMMRRG